VALLLGEAAPAAGQGPLASTTGVPTETEDSNDDKYTPFWIKLTVSAFVLLFFCCLVCCYRVKVVKPRSKAKKAAAASAMGTSAEQDNMSAVNKVHSFLRQASERSMRDERTGPVNARARNSADFTQVIDPEVVATGGNAYSSLLQKKMMTQDDDPDGGGAGDVEEFGFGDDDTPMEPMEAAPDGESEQFGFGADGMSDDEEWAPGEWNRGPTAP